MRLFLSKEVEAETRKLIEITIYRFYQQYDINIRTVSLDKLGCIISFSASIHTNCKHLDMNYTLALELCELHWVRASRQ
jgi:hypothetical protein